MSQTPAPAPRPTVGRTVHYQAHGSADGTYPSVARAAIVTETRRENAFLDETTVGLCVLNPTGMFFNRDVPFSETPQPGCWSWPPRS